MPRILHADPVASDIVPGVVTRARQQADRILAEATRQAGAIRADAQRIADAVVTKANRDAEQVAHEALLAAQLRSSTLRDRALRDARDQIVSVALAAAEKLLHATLDAEPHRIQALVDPILARVRRARRLTLRLHPVDADTLAPLLAASSSSVSHACALRVEPDARLTRGSCVIESDLGSIDARLETRLPMLSKALTELLDNRLDLEPKSEG